MEVELRHPVTVYSLGPDGFSPLAITDAAIHMLDRNVVSWLGGKSGSESTDCPPMNFQPTRTLTDPSL